MDVSLWNLGNRLVMDTELLKKHPENSDMLKKRIKQHKEDIVRCVCDNMSNNKLKEIMFE